MTFKDSLILGLLIGLSVLTKAQGLILFPLIIIAALFVYKHKKMQEIKLTYGNLLVSILTGIIVCSGWFIRNIVVHGELMPQSINAPLMKSMWIFALEPLVAFQYVMFVTRDLFGYFWTPFWLVRSYVNAVSYNVCILILMLLPLIGIVVRIVKRQVSGGSLLTILMVALAINYFLYIRHVLFVDFFAKQQGRLLLPTASAISAYFILGLDSLLFKSVYKKAAIIAGCIFMIAVNIAVMACCRSQYAL